MNDVFKKLEGGDWRSIGRADKVVVEVLNDPSLFELARCPNVSLPRVEQGRTGSYYRDSLGLS